jgi:hypothetical protein
LHGQVALASACTARSCERKLGQLCHLRLERLELSAQRSRQPLLGIVDRGQALLGETPLCWGQAGPDQARPQGQRCGRCAGEQADDQKENSHWTAEHGGVSDGMMGACRLFGVPVRTSKTSLKEGGRGRQSIADGKRVVVCPHAVVLRQASRDRRLS